MMDALQLFKDLLWNDKIKPILNLLMIVCTIYLSAEAYGVYFTDILPVKHSHMWYVFDGYNLLEIIIAFGFVVFCQGIVLGIVSLIHWQIVKWINDDVRLFCKTYNLDPKRPLPDHAATEVKRYVRPLIFKIANYFLNEEQRLQDVFNEVFSIDGYRLNSRFCIIFLSMFLALYIFLGYHEIILVFLIFTSIYFIISGFVIKAIVNFKSLIIEIYSINEHHSNQRAISN